MLQRYNIFSKFTNRIVFLFSRVNEGADDEAAEGGVWFWIGVRVSVGFLAVGSEFLFPLQAEFGSIQDDCGLVDGICKCCDSALAFGCNRTFIRMFDYISMSATVAGAHDNLVVGSEFARHGVERM